jgi:hypothetical protein
VSVGDLIKRLPALVEANYLPIAHQSEAGWTGDY